MRVPTERQVDAVTVSCVKTMRMMRQQDFQITPLHGYIHLFDAHIHFIRQIRPAYTSYAHRTSIVSDLYDIRLIQE